jgi:hypothetical protein
LFDVPGELRRREQRQEVMDKLDLLVADLDLDKHMLWEPVPHQKISTHYYAEVTGPTCRTALE